MQTIPVTFTYMEKQYDGVLSRVVGAARSKHLAPLRQ